MKSLLLNMTLLFLVSNILNAQQKSENQRIDMHLIKGDYARVIDTCNLILKTDSLNAEIHYKLGLALQNVLSDDKALSSFIRAASLDPENKKYSFTMAKGYFNKGKNKFAEPVFMKLASSDSANWIYAFYLTSIYMQTNRYDESIEIYERFLKNDPLNPVYLDKTGFAYLRKGDFATSIDLYNSSMKISSENISAIKNLSYLYASTGNSDTAIYLLTRGISIDRTDMDLYSRRAQLYFSKNYTKRALDDYLVLLASGDSSAINLKRAGIGYCNNLQPAIAIRYLLKSYIKDSSDYETSSYLGQSYYNLQDMKRSIYYYQRVLKILSPIYLQTGLTYVLLAESQKGAGRFNEAITSYLKSQEFKVDPNIYMIIANIYDEQFDNKAKAIQYYQLFLNTMAKSKTAFSAEYIDAVKKRLEFLKEEQKK